jgi:eukaryotic-like serine/threonine-protein kinase
MPVDYDKVKKIFLDALKLQSVQEQKAFIEEGCGTDIDLRNFVLGMHEAHQQIVTPIPEGPTVFDSQAHANQRPALEIGSILDGKYKIIELIAEGGMGIVYRANRVTDLRMEVAIKVIRPGMDSQQVLARFKIEQQALAMMKHENIARVLDAGMTDQRLPYIVMELVKGRSLTRFCDESKLSIQQRLELFEQICAAVQHAHQKGIVHRDLKPNNILVAMFDDKPVPKIIDFGLAKALHQPLTDDDLKTKFGTFVGTWQYTAPEQAQLNNLDVDTRADIYSLGVILYELLTGTTPLEKKRIVHAAYEEVLRIIREEEPLKPSTRIHSSEQLPSIAALRHTEPVKLEKQIRGELDWIVMKALDKDRNRRYATANEFGRDISAFLNGEQIAAAPPSMGYRMACFYRKNKGKILTAATMALLLIAGIITSTIGFIYARRSEKQAREQLSTANALEEFIDKGMFSSVDPRERATLKLPMENNILVRDMLARSAASVNNGVLSSQPIVESRVRHTLGKAFYAIGEYDQAAKQLVQAEKLANEHLGKLSEERLLIIEHQGDLALYKANYPQSANFPQARKDYQEALEGWRGLFGNENHNALRMQLNLLELDRIEANTEEEYPKIEAQVQSLLKPIAATRDQVLLVQAHLLQADLFSLMNQTEKARAVLESTLIISKASLGTENPETLAVMNNLAMVLKKMKKHEEAEVMYLDLIKKAEHVFNPDPVLVGLYKNNYASLCVDMRKYPAAEKLFQESLAIFQKISQNHPYTLQVRFNVLGMKLVQNDFDGALRGYDALDQVFQEVFGEQHPRYQQLVRDRARALIALKSFDKASIDLKKLIKIAVDSKGKQVQQLVIGLKDIKKNLEKANEQNEYDKLINGLIDYIQQISTSPQELIQTVRSVK